MGARATTRPGTALRPDPTVVRYRAVVFELALGVGMSGDTEDPKDLPPSVLDALEDRAVERILLDLQGASITVLGVQTPEEVPVVEADGVAPDADPQRFRELRDHLGLDRTPSPAPRVAVDSLVPDSQDSSLYVEAARSEPVRRVPAAPVVAVVVAVAAALWLAAVWVFGGL